MVSNMVEITTTMLAEWTARASATGTHETDVEPYIVRNAADIIAMASFGVDDSKGKAAFDKFKALQVALFSPNRLAGVPFGEYVQARRTAVCRRLGEEIDGLLLSVIESRQRKSKGEGEGEERIDLLGLLMRSGKGLTARELVDECKTFFFAGHETTALAITWTMFLLALHPDWQRQLREEVAEATGGGDIDAVAVTKLTKMTWVMNEVLRLYPSAPNLLRQAREDIWVGDKTVIPHGTNIWIDAVGMHHDRALWGVDVDEFRPERFKDSPYGGCTHRMGYVPFGYGGRVCVGKNLSVLEYKVVVSLILKRFSLSLSPNYEHSPAVMLTMRPSRGMPLILETL
ncbi:Cytokinin hydroxylase [Acorus calamus]|uniref:Cytokinin hydroxylase n=1 Tax=Acorus calamus TaxID=4465 RepID=A0AAV9C4F5_ACOCL|nr:Cytokinin hydroxylase [Acorus calamus]